MSHGLNEYGFFAIVEERRQREVKKIVASQQLVEEMAGIFDAQAKDLLSDRVRKIDFDPRFKADGDDLFHLKAFQVPEYCIEAAISSAKLSPLILNDTINIKSIFSVDFTADAKLPRFLFQKFNRSRFLKPGFSFMSIGGTLHSIVEGGLTLDTQISAIAENGNLYFRSYQTVSQFLDLTNYFVEATDEDIEVVVKHEIIHVENIDALMPLCDSQMRRKFSFVKLSGVLDRVTPQTISTRAKQFEIVLKTKEGKLQFPQEKKELKRVLDFLCERLYTGALTEDKYEANSHRKIADAKAKP